MDCPCLQSHQHQGQNQPYTENLFNLGVQNEEAVQPLWVSKVHTFLHVIWFFLADMHPSSDIGLPQSAKNTSSESTTVCLLRTKLKNYEKKEKKPVC